MSASTENRKINIAILLKWLVSFLLPLIIYLLPTNETYTAPMQGFLVATIFFICLAAFELLPVLLPALMLPTLYIMLDVVPTSVALNTWSNNLMMFSVIGGFVFANALDECGLIKRIVYWAAVKCKGKYTTLLYVILLVCFFVQFITFTNAWLVCLILCYGMVSALDLKFTKAGIIVMMIGQIVSCTPCVIMFSPALAGLYQSGAQMVDPNFTVGILTQFYYGWPLIICEIIIVFIFTRLYKVSNFELKGGKEYFDQEYAAMGKMSREEKIAVIISCLMLLYLLTQYWHGFDVYYAFIFIPILLYIPAFHVGTTASLEKINVGFVVFIASCMAIGNVGTAVGIGNAISTIATPLLAGLPKPIFLYGCLIFGIFMNILMTPGAMMALFPGPLGIMGEAVGLNSPMTAAVAMYLSNELIFLPYENSYALIMYGFGTMTLKDFLQFNLIKMGLFLILFGIIFLPYWYLIGVM